MILSKVIYLGKCLDIQERCNSLSALANFDCIMCLYLRIKGKFDNNSEN